MILSIVEICHVLFRWFENFCCCVAWCMWKRVNPYTDDLAVGVYFTNNVGKLAKLNRLLRQSKTIINCSGHGDRSNGHIQCSIFSAALLPMRLLAFSFNMFGPRETNHSRNNMGYSSRQSHIKRGEYLIFFFNQTPFTNVFQFGTLFTYPCVYWLASYTGNIIVSTQIWVVWFKRNTLFRERYWLVITIELHISIGECFLFPRINSNI